MLKLVIPPQELFDEAKNEFLPGFEGKTITMEHSLVSISKWEAKWHKSFFTTEEKTTEELLDYFYFMTITQNVSRDIFNYLSVENVKQLTAYINDPMTATTINEHGRQHNNQVITSELIYSWMIELHIPVEFQKWHINRLLTLIRVRNIREAQASGSGKKMSKGEILRQNKALNDARRKKYNTRG